MPDWLEQQLEHNKIIVRGVVDPDNPFGFEMYLYILQNNPNGRTSLVRCTYYRNKFVPHFPTIDYCHSDGDWRRSWLRLSSRWQNLWLADRQVVVTSSKKGAVMPITPLSYLPQLYGMIELLQMTPYGLGTLYEERSILLARLKAVYRENWKQVSDVVGIL